MWGKNEYNSTNSLTNPSSNIFSMFSYSLNILFENIYYAIY